ncbi:hypothetical protein D3C86_1222430 [compost metagenome]
MCAIDQAGQHVAPDRIGAEEEAGTTAFLPDRRDEQRIAILLGRIMRRDQGRKDRDEDEENEDGKADDGAAVLTEVEPEIGDHPAADGGVRKADAGGGDHIGHL